MFRGRSQAGSWLRCSASVGTAGFARRSRGKGGKEGKRGRGPGEKGEKGTPGKRVKRGGEKGEKGRGPNPSKSVQIRLRRPGTGKRGKGDADQIRPNPSKSVFADLTWLDKEVFLAPPQGDKRHLDLVARLRLRADAPPPVPGLAELLTLVHVEVESRDSIQPFWPRMFEYYVQLRRDSQLPVLPIGLLLRVGLDGIG